MCVLYEGLVFIFFLLLMDFYRAQEVGWGSLAPCYRSNPDLSAAIKPGASPLFKGETLHLEVDALTLLRLSISELGSIIKRILEASVKLSEHACLRSVSVKCSCYNCKKVLGKPEEEIYKSF